MGASVYREPFSECLPNGQPFFGAAAPTPLTPTGAVLLWATMALNLPAMLVGFEDLTSDPARWRGRRRREVTALFDRRVIARTPRYLDGRRVAHVKVLPYGSDVDPDPGGELPVSSAAVVLEHCPDGWWRVREASRM